MSKKCLKMFLLLVFSIGMTISCTSSKNSETEELRKELDKIKKEKEDEKLAKQKETESANQKSGGEKDKDKDKEATNKPAATPTSTPKPKVSAPVGATVAYCNGGNVLVRDSPSLNGRKVNTLKKGEKVFVIEESDNYDEWQGTEANWAYIQKEDGSRGWVFTPFISYQ